MLKSFFFLLFGKSGGEGEEGKLAFDEFGFPTESLLLPHLDFLFLYFFSYYSDCRLTAAGVAGVGSSRKSGFLTSISPVGASPGHS